MIHFLLAATFSLLSSAQANLECPPLLDVVAQLHKGEEESALKDLQCLHVKYPEDLDVIEILSDLHWRRNEIIESQHYARLLLKQDPSKISSGATFRMHRRLARLKASINLQGVASDKSNNYEALAEASLFYRGKNSLSYSFLRDSRTYSGTATLVDLSHRVSVLITPSRYFYASAAISWVPDPSFMPKWKYELDPHFVWRFLDIGSGVKISNYEEENVVALIPSALFEVNDSLSLGIKTDWTVHPQQALNVQAFANQQISSFLFGRISITYGKSYEGDGLTTAFFSSGAALNIRTSKFLSFTADASSYRSDLRDEYRVGLKLEFLL